MTLRESALLEVGQKSVPGFIDKSRVLGEFSLDHELFDMVDRVDVGHAVVYDTANFLQSFEGAHGGDGVSLDEDVGAGEEL